MQTPTETVWTLIAVEDLRPLDFYTGKRLPLGTGEGNECQRCGKLHAVVYTVRRRISGETKKVGSSCVVHLCEGWAPNRVELAAAKRLDRERAKESAESVARAEIAAGAASIARQVLDALRVAEPRFLRWEGRGPHRVAVWGDPEAENGARVWAPHGSDTELSMERRRAYLKAVAERACSAVIGPNPGSGPAYSRWSDMLKAATLRVVIALEQVST